MEPPEMNFAQQVSGQCKVIMYLASQVSLLHGDLQVLALEESAEILDIIGKRSAWLMEVLADFLNNADAGCLEWDWMNPIFDEAHKRFPV